jgi:hypothetical protein
MQRWLVAMAVTLGAGALLPSSAVAGTGTLSISLRPTPTVGLPLSIGVSGKQLPVGDLVRVYLFSNATGCWIEEGVGQKLRAGGQLLGSGEVLSKEEGDEDPEDGVFSRSYNMIPASASIPYTVCAELSEGGERNPPKAWETTFTAAPAPPPGHLTTLSVRLDPHAGTIAARPGETELLIGATPDADLRLVLKRDGHTLTKRLSLGANSSGKLIVPWSCAAPGGVYSYTITATDTYGASLTRTGKFRPVSTARCRALRAADKRRRSQKAGERHEQEARSRREGRETEQEDERVRKDQRVYCEQRLGGQVEQVYNGAMIPAIPSEIETECYAHGHNYTLRGDPPKVTAG